MLKISQDNSFPRTYSSIEDRFPFTFFEILKLACAFFCAILASPNGLSKMVELCWANVLIVLHFLY